MYVNRYDDIFKHLDKADHEYIQSLDYDNVSICSRAFYDNKSTIKTAR